MIICNQSRASSKSQRSWAGPKNEIFFYYEIDCRYSSSYFENFYYVDPEFPAQGGPGTDMLATHAFGVKNINYFSIAFFTFFRSIVCLILKHVWILSEMAVGQRANCEDHMVETVLASRSVITLKLQPISLFTGKIANLCASTGSAKRM